jgi:hypothetical protein
LPHDCLRRQMHDVKDAVPGKPRCRALAIGDIQPGETKRGVRHQLS